MEDLIYPFLESVKNEVEAILPKPVGRAVVAPGTAPAWDDCCQGQLAVRLVNTQVRNTSPRPVGCKHQGYIYTIGISVIRCAQTIDDRGRAPKPDKISKDASNMTADMVAVQHFLECNDTIFQMLSWSPQGVTGGCHGGEWLFTLLQEPLGCCD